MTRANTARLLVSCPDRKGLVAAMTGLLSELGANVLDLHQHTDQAKQWFFQRIEFDLSGAVVERAEFEQRLRNECQRHDMSWTISYSEIKKRVAIFTSKYEHCIYDLLLRHRIGELDCDIPVIVSNHEDQRAIADNFGIPFYCFPITKETKPEQERKEIELLKELDIDLVVMARYMQILSDDFISHFPSRIINIHHSTLPAFVGAKPYHQAFERGVKLIGATAHYATADLDEGPIIAQGVEDATHSDSVDDLIRKGRDVERITLSKAVLAHLEERIFVQGRSTIVF